jgi:hypothetical protein
MLVVAQAILLVGIGIGSACGGVAWVIWAGRCDPKGIFRYPPISRVTTDVIRNEPD